MPSFDRVRVADFEPALEAAMAKTPDRAVALMEAVWKPAVARVREEVADMQAIADAEGAGIRIEPWDYRFYAAKVRKAKYDLDESEITPQPAARKAAGGDVLHGRRTLRLSFPAGGSAGRAGLPPGRRRRSLTATSLRSCPTTVTTPSRRRANRS